MRENGWKLWNPIRLQAGEICRDFNLGSEFLRVKEEEPIRETNGLSEKQEKSKLLQYYWNQEKILKVTSDRYMNDKENEGSQYKNWEKCKLS